MLRKVLLPAVNRGTLTIVTGRQNPENRTNHLVSSYPGIGLWRPNRQARSRPVCSRNPSSSSVSLLDKGLQNAILSIEDKTHITP